MRRLLYVLPVILFGILALFFLKGLGRNPAEIPSVLIDKPAPAFALPPLRDGQPGVAAADFQGQVTLVNFFASWCVPCRAEHPLLVEMTSKNKVNLVGINYKDKPEDALAWLERLGDPYHRIGADRDGRAAIDWGVYGVPESYVIDRQGRIRFKQTGPITPEMLDKTILPLLAELSK